ncbi:hypothetical protein PHMEG_00032039 [Phytophthora megakarya]|uniref:Uncharacterized protein n=1 Tax=Phytophthora megakarya TaxID=4795 RepID=A0A225UZ13_9STRA|nr:hypothetical protein PHMEG_00032039 [Phytophthora megakarya]
MSSSAFSCGEKMTEHILTPLKEGDVGIFVPSVRRVAKVMSITFGRQSVEWGMGLIEDVFHRLLMPLPVKQCLENLFRLANYWARIVGISDINTTFIHGREDNMQRLYIHV